MAQIVTSLNGGDTTMCRGPLYLWAIRDLVFSAVLRPRRSGAADRPDRHRCGTPRIVATLRAHSRRSEDPRLAHGSVLPPTYPRCCRRRPLPFRWVRPAVRRPPISPGTRYPSSTVRGSVQSTIQPTTGAAPPSALV